jgi:multiple sugar transport system substrate-binding protein
LIKRGLFTGLALSPVGRLFGGSNEKPSNVEFGNLAKAWTGSTLNVSLIAEPRSDAIKQLVPEFTKATGITVNINPYPYSTLLERQFTAVNQRSGTLDIIHTDCCWMGQFGGQGWLHPVTEFVKRTNPTVLDYDDFIPRSIEEQCMWEKTLYGLPFITAVMTLYYRKDIFAKHSLQPPQTWDELKQMAEKINQDESRNGVAGLTMIAKRSSSLVCTHLDVFASFGGYYYDSKYNPTMTSDASVQSLEFLKSLLAFCNQGVLAQDYDESAALFKQGRAAMNIHWQNSAPQYVAEHSPIADSVAITTLPGVAKDGNVLKTPCIGGWNMGIVADSPNKEPAWEFIVWATSKDVERRLAQYGTGARASTLSDPDLGKKYIEYPTTLEALKQSVGRPRIPEWTQMGDLFAAQFSNALTGQAAVKDTLAKTNDSLKDILKSYRS